MAKSVSNLRLARQNRARRQRPTTPKKPRRKRKAEREGTGLPVALGHLETGERRKASTRSTVEPRDQGVLLDEQPPGLDVVAHQLGEDFVGGDPVFDLHFEQPPGLRIHRGLPKLLRVHLSETLVALDRRAAFDFSQQPFHRFGKIGDRLLLVFTHGYPSGTNYSLK